MKYNNELEKIDTIEKSYLLGLLFADGSNSIKNNDVRLSLIDKEIIEDLHQIFPFFRIETFDYSKYNSNNKKQYSLRLKNKNLSIHLYNHGMLNRKSTDNKDFLILPKSVNDELMSHFIRGYFDGNGSISISKARPNVRRVEICSSSKTFILDLKNYLDCYVDNLETIYNSKENTSSILHRLEWHSYNNVTELKDYMYINANLYLKRKKDLFDSLKLVDKTNINNPNCPNCNDLMITKGYRTTKQGEKIRYKCRKCNYNLALLKNRPEPSKSDELLETPKDLTTCKTSDNVKYETMDNQQPSL